MYNIFKSRSRIVVPHKRFSVETVEYFHSLRIKYYIIKYYKNFNFSIFFFPKNLSFNKKLL